MANDLVQTSLAAAVDASSNFIAVASATNITRSEGGRTETVLYVENEAMNVVGVSGTQIEVMRGMLGTRAKAHVSGEPVFSGRPRQFLFVDPSGAALSAEAPGIPGIVPTTGNQWLISSVSNKWIPGFGNPGNSGMPVMVSAAVASAAGQITPSGPAFHITGTNAITGFVNPTGLHDGDVIAVIPDGIFTWTTANNIAVAGTAVVSKLLLFKYDAATNKWYPSYVA